MNLIKPWLVRLKRFIKASEGIAALEFALAAPILFTLFLGAFEFTRYILIVQKTEKIAYSISDIVSQYESLTNAQLNDIFIASTQLMEPYTFGHLGKVYVSSVQKSTTYPNPTNIIWQRNGGGTLAASSQVGSEGYGATLPNSLALSDGENVIVSEVYYTYTPIFTMGGLLATTVLYRTSVFKPRLGNLTTAPT